MVSRAINMDDIPGFDELNKSDVFELDYRLGIGGASISKITKGRSSAATIDSSTNGSVGSSVTGTSSYTSSTTGSTTTSSSQQPQEIHWSGVSNSKGGGGLENIEEDGGFGTVTKRCEASKFKRRFSADASMSFSELQLSSHVRPEKGAVNDDASVDYSISASEQETDHRRNTCTSSQRSSGNSATMMKNKEAAFHQSFSAFTSKLAEPRRSTNSHSSSNKEIPKNSSSGEGRRGQRKVRRGKKKEGQQQATANSHFNMSWQRMPSFRNMEESNNKKPSAKLGYALAGGDAWGLNNSDDDDGAPRNRSNGVLSAHLHNSSNRFSDSFVTMATPVEPDHSKKQSNKCFSDSFLSRGLPDEPVTTNDLQENHFNNFTRDPVDEPVRTNDLQDNPFVDSFTRAPTDEPVPRPPNEDNRPPRRAQRRPSNQNDDKHVARNTPRRTFSGEEGSRMTPRRTYSGEEGSRNTPRRTYSSEEGSRNTPRRTYSGEDRNMVNGVKTMRRSSLIANNSHEGTKTPRRSSVTNGTMTPKPNRILQRGRSTGDGDATPHQQQHESTTTPMRRSHSSDSVSALHHHQNQRSPSKQRTPSGPKDRLMASPKLMQTPSSATPGGSRQRGRSLSQKLDERGTPRTQTKSRERSTGGRSRSTSIARGQPDKRTDRNRDRSHSRGKSRGRSSSSKRDESGVKRRTSFTRSISREPSQDRRTTQRGRSIQSRSQDPGKRQSERGRSQGARSSSRTRTGGSVPPPRTKPERGRSSNARSVSRSRYGTAPPLSASSGANHASFVSHSSVDSTKQKSRGTSLGRQKKPEKRERSRSVAGRGTRTSLSLDEFCKNETVKSNDLASNSSYGGTVQTAPDDDASLYSKTHSYLTPQSDTSGNTRRKANRRRSDMTSEMLRRSLPVANAKSEEDEFANEDSAFARRRHRATMTR